MKTTPYALAMFTRRSTRIAYCFVRQLVLLAYEVPFVFWFMAKFKARALPPQHPWISGYAYPNAAPIWHANIAYRSISAMAHSDLRTDQEIAEKTGQFLAKMVERSIVPNEIPHGPQRRMPHAVNYIHGAVHYNGVFLIFDDFLDLIRHLSNTEFRHEVLRLGRIERREVTFLMRNRDYDPLDFAYCIGAVRAYLPWFSNGNGPTKKPVLWGNMAPYPAVNLINGSWMRDLHALLRGELAQIIRPPIASERYFLKKTYPATQTRFQLIDKLLAWYMYTDVRARGFRGQLFFTNRSRIEPQRRAQFEAEGGYWRWVACHKVPFPLTFSGLRVRQK
jgi:hypothetical protein